MGHDYSKDVNNLREDSERRERAYREELQRRELERAKSEREAREAMEEQHERMIKQQQQEKDRLMDVMREKDRQVELERQDKERKLAEEREEARQEREKNLKFQQAAIDKLSETEKKHKEDILKQTSEHQKLIEEKSHQQEVLHQQMIKAKEEDHERMLKRLKEQQSEFQKMQDEDRRIIDSKSDEVKQTMEKIFEVQVEGTKKVDETREHLTRQYKEELERASAKTEAKAKELADANEKILNTQKEGAEMVQKISKEKDAEKEKAIEKMEERKAKDLEMIQAVHKSELDSAKQHSDRMFELNQKHREDFKSFQNALMEKDKVITAGHEKMLEYVIKGQKDISQVQESRIRDLKIMSAHDKMNQALIMLSAMNNANNPAQNQLLNLLVQSLQDINREAIKYKSDTSEFSTKENQDSNTTTEDYAMPPRIGESSSSSQKTEGKSHDILGTPNQVYQYWLETLDKSCQECSSGINTVKELKSRKVIALIEAAASHHVTLNESLLKTWDEFACCSTGQSSQLSDLQNQLKDFVQLISNEIESHKNRCQLMLADHLEQWTMSLENWVVGEHGICKDRMKTIYEKAQSTGDVTMMKTQCAAICEPLIDVIRSYLPDESEVTKSLNASIKPGIESYLSHLEEQNLDFKNAIHFLIKDSPNKCNEGLWAEVVKDFQKKKDCHIQSIRTEMKSSETIFPSLMNSFTKLHSK